MNKTEAIQKFLSTQPYQMGHLYNPDLEVQVNVARDEGEPIHGEYAGLRWQGFTDGLQTWKHFRIPWNASHKPEYIDRPIRFDISEHVEAIGMTGWDYKNQRSKWVGFDFDSILEHKQGLTEDELETIKMKLIELPFITIYSSTGGKGIHVYVFIESDELIENHTQHAAVARAILAKISALTGLSFNAKVDTLGGNMWVWHRKAKVNTSFILIKQGDSLNKIPTNWKEYLTLVSKYPRQEGKSNTIDSLVSAKRSLEIDEEHIRLLRWFEDSNALWWFDDKKQMLVCHTYDLKNAHSELKLKGIFDTISTGKEQGNDQNCFAFPLHNGGWVIRRHSKGVVEKPIWFTDSSGWTSCYFNKTPTFRAASSCVGGTEGEKDYSFHTLKQAIRALNLMEIDVSVPEGMQNRPATIAKLKDSRIKITFEATEHDNPPTDWVLKKKNWERYFFRPRLVDELEIPDQLIRHVISGDADWGWFLYTNNKWIQESRRNITSVLVSQGYKRDNIELIMGTAVLNNWILVSKPFQLEYPGNREWNKESAQFKYIPKKGKHPAWDLIFQHCGFSLNEALAKNEWAKDNGIINGLLYLQAWCAACIQNPNEPTPYLFFFGGQNTGKSIFHEALSLLFTSGYVRADNSLTNPSGFNGELAPGVFCVIEETNLSKRGYASDRIKDWVTGKTISIHTKGRTPYNMINNTHWIQCANNPDYCPIIPGDTRITMIRVDKPENEIPKFDLLKRCGDEAPAFLDTLINFELPSRVSRLQIAVIETKEKQEQMEYNKSALETFINENIFPVKGRMIEFAELYNRFQLSLATEERFYWSRKKVSKQLPFIKGRAGNDNRLFVGNVSFDKNQEPTHVLKQIDNRLISIPQLSD